MGDEIVALDATHFFRGPAHIVSNGAIRPYVDNGSWNTTSPIHSPFPTNPGLAGDTHTTDVRGNHLIMAAPSNRGGAGAAYLYTHSNRNYQNLDYIPHLVSGQSLVPDTTSSLNFGYGASIISEGLSRSVGTENRERLYNFRRRGPEFSPAAVQRRAHAAKPGDS